MDHKFIVIDNAGKSNVINFFYTKEEAQARFDFLIDPKNKPTPVFTFGAAKNDIRVILAEIVKDGKV